jgi:formylglycine-generating enzyme required for sulfatase activity
MNRKTRNAAGWFLVQLLLATLLSDCTFERDIEEFRRKQGYETPVAGDFAASGLSQIYDGSPKRVSITPKQGKSSGAITVYYVGTGDTKYPRSAAAPSALGTYAVTFDVAETTGWKAASGLSAGTLKIIDVDIIVNSIAEFAAWLAAQPANSTAAPYFVALNISDLGGNCGTAGSLGNVLFANDTKYVSLDLSGSTFTSIPGSAFAFFDGPLIGCKNLTGITIPGSVTSIGALAFFECRNLASVTIPDSVTSIGNQAFYCCSSLASVTIGNSVTSIGVEAFFGCGSLASVTIGNSVTSIGESAFYGCGSLASVTIGNSVTSIGESAFYGCTSLTSVTFEGTIPSGGFDADAFLGDLRAKFYATDPTNGTPGTYITTAPVNSSSVWTKSAIEMAYVPSGSFQMGNTTGYGYNNELPVHTVTLSGFYMGKYQVTQDQWQAVTGSNPSYFTTAVAGESGTPGKLPVEQVNWYDAIVFCNRLSTAEGLSPAYSILGSADPSDWGAVPIGSNDEAWNAAVIVSGANGYRLPTEAQWEYAAQGGNGLPGNYTYSGSNNAGDVAWHSGNSGNMTHEVGKKVANGLGLYDMSGNVYEWCWDWYGVYTNEAQADPTGAVSGANRVLRGGSWYNSAEYMRSAYRNGLNPCGRGSSAGFRLVRP